MDSPRRGEKTESRARTRRTQAGSGGTRANVDSCRRTTGLESLGPWPRIHARVKTRREQILAVGRPRPATSHGIRCGVRRRRMIWRGRRLRLDRTGGAQRTDSRRAVGRRLGMTGRFHGGKFLIFPCALPHRRATKKPLRCGTGGAKVVKTINTLAARQRRRRTERTTRR